MAIAKKVRINPFYAPLDEAAFSNWQSHNVGDFLYITENGAVVEVVEKRVVHEGSDGWSLEKLKVIDGTRAYEDFRTLSTVYSLESQPDVEILVTDSAKVLDDNWFEKVFDMIAKKYTGIHFTERLQSEQEYIEQLDRTYNDLSDFDNKRNQLLFAESVINANEEAKYE